MVKDYISVSIERECYTILKIMYVLYIANNQTRWSNEILQGDTFHIIILCNRYVVKLNDNIKSIIIMYYLGYLYSKQPSWINYRVVLGISLYSKQPNRYTNEMLQGDTFRIIILCNRNVVKLNDNIK